MSRAGARVPMLQLQVRIADAAATIATLPAATRAVFRAGLYEILSHHRTSVIKHSARTMPGGRSAQQMVASRLFRFTKETAGGITGEGWAAAVSKSGDDAKGGYANNPRFFPLIEEGGQHRTSGWMAVPVTDKKGVARQRFADKMRQLLKQDALKIVPRPGQVSLLVQVKEDHTYQLWGVLARRTTIRPMLGFYDRWSSTLSKDLPHLERWLDRAMKGASVAGLEQAMRERAMGQQVYLAEFKKQLAELHAAGYKGAKRVRMAAKAASEARGASKNVWQRAAAIERGE
ncbi:MAG: hypothetical protein AMXMBFR58_29540 [Phycisphaerae bacterium]